MSVKCPYCGTQIYHSHYCSRVGDTVYADDVRESSGGDALVSGLVTAATGSAILGTLVGGDALTSFAVDILDGDLFD